MQMNKYKTSCFPKTVLWFLCLFWLHFSSVRGNGTDLRRATVVVSQGLRQPVRDGIIQALMEEGRKRWPINWGLSDKWPKSGPVIALALQTDKKLAGRPVPVTTKTLAPEAFFILSTKEEIWIVGEGPRGLLYGIGSLLQNMAISGNSVSVPPDFSFESSPIYAIRGHQLGYRHTANSYDAWTVDQYDQYIRELALFGTNSVENIPFGKENISPHMNIPMEEMNVRMSEICAKYDMDYWVWTPAKFDLKDKDKRELSLREQEAFYKACPRLDNIFFPGGDPGHNHPEEVMPFLKDLYTRLVKYHPGAGIWISLQGFDTDMVDFFYQYLEDERPEWLRGVVSGPSSPPLAETRYRLPTQYKHRQYPDITHNIRCEYSVEGWDQAFALTLGREGPNPLPYFYGRIFQETAPFTDGFISYSDGAHDDVNKFVWTALGVDPEREIRSIVEEYCRFFFGSEVAEKTADGILALEANWKGPLAENGSVETTFAFWQTLEKENPGLVNNWRWQLLLLRAYYDTYIRRRLLYEQDLEKQANKILLVAGNIGAEQAMDGALKVLNKATEDPIGEELLEKTRKYAEMLFQSAGLQTSVEAHQAKGGERGCIMDYIDHPLNNRWWMEDQFEDIRIMKTEEEKLEALERIVSWERPGPGSYYDDVSNIAKSPHVTTTVFDATDFAWWDGGKSRARLSTQTFQNNPELEYSDLDPNGRYLIRVSGYGEALLRVDGERLTPIVYNKELEGFKEFLVPQRSVGDGRLTVSFDQPEESHLNWRKHSKVSDVWLIKR